jgi:vancomycin permeability regulator SanA
VAEPVRVVAVFGYSGRHTDGLLHPICARRLRHAERLSTATSAVVLSGWARHPKGRSEAELMQAAWSGPEVPLVCDTTARSTADNAAIVARALRSLGADEVVVVTSSWHRLRARMLLRAALRDASVAVTTSSPSGAPPLAVLVRELACLLALPIQLLLLRRNDATAGAGCD